MKKIINSLISVVRGSIFLSVICSLSPTHAFAAEQNETIPPIRYVLTTKHYHKDIDGARVNSFLLPKKNDGSFGGGI